MANTGSLEALQPPDGPFGFDATQGLTALAGGGQTGATLLPSYVNQVSVAASAGDSVMLPPANAGQVIVVVNGGGNSIQVFGQPQNYGTGVGDTIVASSSDTPAATATGVAQADKVMAIYACYSAGIWKQMISA